jgi:6-phosphogluconolactonase
MTKIEISESAETMSRAAAERFVRVTTVAARARGRCAVVLSGGSTPGSVYRALAQEPHLTRVPWHRIEFFWSDERHVPPDHPDSNYRAAMEAMLSKVPVAATQIHRMRGEMAEAERAALEYEDAISAVVSGVPVPRFDLILLGLGTDGHTASLFPGTPALDERRRWCTANWVSALNAYRITLTLPVLNAAREIMFIVSGAEKAPIVREALREWPPTSAETPAQVLPAHLIQPHNGDVWWMLDRAAAGE